MFKPVKITLDTCVLNNPENPILIKLEEWKEKGIVKIYVGDHQFLEKNKWKDNNKRNKIMNWIDRNTANETKAHLLPETLNDIETLKDIEIAQGFTFQDEEATEQKIKKIHSPELISKKGDAGKKLINKWVDWQILTEHILHKREYFITNNTKEFINFGKNKNKRRLELEREFPKIKIRELNKELLDEIEIQIKSSENNLND